MGIFKAPKSGSPDSELLVGRLTGVMDLKIFYKGKTRGQSFKEDHYLVATELKVQCFKFSGI